MIHDDMLAAGVPSLGAMLTPTERVALGGVYRTATGQWVIDNGISEWCGAEDVSLAPTAPDAAMILLVTNTFAAYVAPAPIPSDALVRLATVKAARGKVLTQAETDALDYAEAL